MCAYTLAHVHMYVCLDTFVCECMLVFINKCVNVHVHNVSQFRLTHTLIHVCIQTHTHTFRSISVLTKSAIELKSDQLCQGLSFPKK